MTIFYCSLYSRTNQILLCESTKTSSFHKRIKGLFSVILKNGQEDTIEIENGELVTYLRTKKIIFICISNLSIGKQKPIRFIQNLAKGVIKDNNGLDMLTDKDSIKKMCLQEKYETFLNNFLDDYDTGINNNNELISNMTNDLNEMKKELNTTIMNVINNKEGLDELLLVSKDIKTNAKEYKQNAKELEVQTRCCKPWMIILSIVLLILFIVYTIFALYLCGSMSLFCEKKKAPIKYYFI